MSLLLKWTSSISSSIFIIEYGSRFNSYLYLARNKEPYNLICFSKKLFSERKGSPEAGTRGILWKKVFLKILQKL